MTKRIRVCPDCGNPSSMAELQGQAEAKLIRALFGPSVAVPGWSRRAFWCALCEMPFVECWPEDLDLGDRRALVGLPRDLLQIREERGAR